MDDLVYLHVYDEVGIDLLEDERRRETDIHQRLEKRWLGSITIPFSTLYNNGRVRAMLNRYTVTYPYLMYFRNFYILFRNFATRSKERLN